jgi:hypothetical protein
VPIPNEGTIQNKLSRMANLHDVIQISKALLRLTERGKFNHEIAFRSENTLDETQIRHEMEARCLSLNVLQLLPIRTFPICWSSISFREHCSQLVQPRICSKRFPQGKQTCKPEHMLWEAKLDLAILAISILTAALKSSCIGYA